MNTPHGFDIGAKCGHLCIRLDSNIRRDFDCCICDRQQEWCPSCKTRHEWESGKES